MEQGNRFEVIHSQGKVTYTGYIIPRDKKTGVNYLLFDGGSGYGLAITPLLDSDGNPVVTR